METAVCSPAVTSKNVYPEDSTFAFTASARAFWKSSFVIVFRLRAIVPLLPGLSAAVDSFTPVNAMPAIRANAKTFERLLIAIKLERRLFLTKTATVQPGGIVSNMIVLGVEKI